MSSNLFKKYDVPAPRYTSYPTVPYWEDIPTTDQWIQSLQNALSEQDVGWALYLHIPFCETLCTYCGCNTVITKDHKKESPYVDVIHKEWSLYKEFVPDLLKRSLKEVHLGGGTPTFLSSDELERLLSPILSEASSANVECSIEVDPRRTRRDQLERLRKLGFRRVSLGVQDFNYEVQRLVNRIQPFDITRQITDDARSLGYDSVNFDLIYGLPKQTMAHMEATVAQTLELKPDRIALYSYAHVPWIKPAQRLFTEADLPQGEEKRKLYERARALFLNAGYLEIGMDHFALPHDSLSLALKHRLLHRNFMGYTARRTQVLLGLGVSSISETPDCFHQNEKVLTIYERRINKNELATLRGHRLNESDRMWREKILQLMTIGETSVDSSVIEAVKPRLETFINDQLISFETLADSRAKIQINELGRPFMRNICMAFDERLFRKQPQARIFSQSL